MAWQDVVLDTLDLPMDHPQRADPSILVDVWYSPWWWCPGYGAAGNCTHTPADPQGMVLARDDGWKEVMARVTGAGYAAVLSAPYYLNKVNYGSNYYEAWPVIYRVEPTDFPSARRKRKKRASEQQEGGDARNAHDEDDNDDGGGGYDSADDELVKGVEACMWTGYADAGNFLQRLWPAAAAVAERGWSSKETTDVDDARLRLHDWVCAVRARGIPAESLNMAGFNYRPDGTRCVAVPGATGPGDVQCKPRYSWCPA
jgi:hypothetical protein